MMNKEMFIGAYTIAMAMNHLATMILFFIKGEYEISIGLLIMANVTGMLMYWALEKNKK